MSSIIFNCIYLSNAAVLSKYYSGGSHRQRKTSEKEDSLYSMSLYCTVRAEVGTEN